MSFAITCDRCPAELDEPGALLFGPPDAEGKCEKLHLCAACWLLVREVVLGIVIVDD